MSQLIPSAVTAMRLGNGKWENTVFNSRLQPTQIGLGNGVNSQNLLKFAYSYGTTANNGNVLSQTITVPGVANPFVQQYTYDELNRLKIAEETQNSMQTWKQTFTFDRYGNRNFDEANTTTLVKNCGTSPNFTVCTADKKIVNPSVNTANNRLSTSDDYAFDSSGNTTGDAEGRTFVYDADNKQISVSDGNGTIGEYSYDGDGKRIKKIVPSTGETTIFAYDAAGKQVAEYSTIVQTGSNAKTVYTTNDHLGSPRINTDATGQVISRHDYHPFGEEIFTAARTSGLGYTADTVRKQFTGYERDDESNLDFAQARYYNNQHGRFTTVDPYLIVGEIYYEQDQRRANATLNKYISEPQQWNRYSYAINSPLKYTDPLGEKFALPGSPEEQQAALQRLKDVLGDERFALVRQETMDGQIVLSIDNENIPKFQGIGDDDPNKDLSLGLAEILGSSEVVDFVVANTVTGRVLDKNGNFLRNETVDLSSRAVGGGVVVPKENSLSGRMQIVVHPRAGEIATIVMSGATVFSNDGKPLVSTNAMVDAHEIGHVRDRLNSSGLPSIGAKPNSSGPSSVIFENAIRSRIPGNNQIRVKEHH